MTENNDLEDLFAKLSEEKKTRELLSLPENFYIKKTPKTIKNEEFQENDIKNENTTKNIIKMIENLKKIRIQKLLIYLAYERRLPTPMPMEEESLYKHIKNILNENIQNNNKNTKIKIINDIPEIISPDGKRLGPFSKGKIITLENENDIEFIIKNKIGETL